MACANSDIRPADLSPSVDEAAVREGRAWIDRAVEAHGGQARFVALKTVELELTDRWPGWFMRMVASPWRVVYAGEVEISGRPMVRVVVSWGTVAPQDDVDQYILYLDRETARLHWLEYTVRDQMAHFVGRTRYSDWRTIEGLQVPFLMQVVDELGQTETGLHEMVVAQARFGQTPDLVPRPDPAATK